jgi:hypothetical protein
MSDDTQLLAELLRNAKRRTYVEYVSGDFSVEREQIQIGRRLEQQVLEQFAWYIRNRGYTLGSVSEEKLQWAREKLYGGQVAAVDGRRDKPLDLISGVFCEVGIASVTYQTLSKPELSCRSITSHLAESLTAEDYYRNLKENRLHESTITAAMIYWELEACLNSPAEWVLKDGPILHQDLIWKGYPFLIDLLRKVVQRKTIIGVAKDLRAEGSIPFRRLGKLLEPGQYLVIYKGVTDEWIKPFRLNDAAKRFRTEEGQQIWRGVFKARVKSYGFEIHKDVFEDGMAILMADAMNNKRGVPNLVDQADTIAGSSFPSGLFGEKIKREFLLAGMGEYWELIDEHELRG